MAAGQLLGVNYRQAKRAWRRYEEEGDDMTAPRLMAHSKPAHIDGPEATRLIPGTEAGPAAGPEDLSLATALRHHVQLVYQKAQQNQRRTARLLGISRATLSRYLTKYALK